MTRRADVSALARRAAIMMMAVALVFVAACTPAESTKTEIALPDPLPIATPNSPLPYEGLTLSPEERSKLEKAYSKLVARCAERYGLKLHLVSETPEALGEGYAMWPGRFGTLPMEHAQKYGYHASPKGPGTKPFTVFVNEDEQPQLAVLDGVYEPGVDQMVTASGANIPDGGCRGEVSRSIGGDPRSIGVDNAKELRLRALNDPRTQAARLEWTRCMRGRGYTFAEIDEPIDSMLGQRLTEEEKTLAVADVTCTRSSRWSDLAFAIERQLQESAIAESGDELELELDHERLMLAAAIRLADQIP